jgi:O-antigen ligase
LNVARKKRIAPAAPAPAPVRVPARGAPDAPGLAVPAILAVMMFLTPALGMTREEMLQDTLKSAIVSLAALLAALVFFWSQRSRKEPPRWHAALWLPLMLMAYALGSMAWSHTYLGAVEAIRWFIFSLLMWLGLNTLSRERLPLLSWGIVAGGAVASLWAALQFLFDFSLFPQGPHPASTFVNRNFFAEFAICTLPFGAILLARARKSGPVALLSAICGLIILTILMTGTRAGLVALWLQLFVLFPLAAWRYRSRLPFAQWPRATKALCAAILVGTVVGLGAVPTGDPQLAAEGRGLTALERAFNRTASITPGDPSLSLRLVMWKATGRMIAAHPIAGVGAGAWENEIPLYQADGAQLETDFYVHNEYLQLVAEYGLVGWLFLAGLAVCLLDAARRTFTQADADEGAWRAVLLCSLLSLLIVSNVGFAWRLAATGAIFALCMGALAASDARLAGDRRRLVRPLPWRPSFSTPALGVVVAALGLAVHITEQAARCEYDIVRASRLALAIAASPNPNDPRWDRVKAELLASLREGVGINPHYRKITPVAADELARWGDWSDAIWIWESVLSSRPYIVAILTNVARGYLATGHPEKAVEYLERAKHIQPGARSVRSAEVLIHARTGQDAKALEKGREAIADGIFDYDLTNAVFVVARRSRDFALAEKAMRLRLAGWSVNRVQGFMELARMFDKDMGQPAPAIDAYREALTLASDSERQALWPEIPADLRGRLPAALAPVPNPATSAQTSASKG